MYLLIELNVPSHRTKLYGRNSVCISATFTWNYLQNLHRNILFHKITRKCLKKLLTIHFLKKYVWHDFSHNISSSTIVASKITGYLFNWKWLEILFSRFSLALEEGLVEMVYAFIKRSWWYHGGMWKWRFLYWFSAWPNRRSVRKSRTEQKISY